MRKHISWYLKGLKDSNQVKNMINQIQDKDQVKEVLLQYRDNIVN